MEPISRRRWLPRQAHQVLAQITQLGAALNLSPLCARVLAGRGLVDPEQAGAFLQARLAALPDPGLLRSMDRAAERLARAVREQHPVEVHGDYDVDGISAAALLVESLRAMGAQVDFHIPLRLRDGYGLSADALRAAQARGKHLVVSVDCGISAVAEARLAAELGLDLIITDHHQPPQELPRALALINPHLPDDAFPDKHLAGVGVAFFLALAVRRELRAQGWFHSRPEPDLKQVLDLVALGTIADIVPLTGVNRILTRAGLDLMAQDRRPGLAALRQVAGVREINCGAVGFQLAPRLNAAGRLEDAAAAVRLLLTEDADEARAIAEQLDACNRQRQAIEAETFSQALERLAELDQPRRNSIVLADERWHPGVIGIVASRLVERFHRPTVLIALEQGRGKGSARSIRGFHLYQALERCSTELQGFGGHEYAAGLTLSAHQVESFDARFENVAHEWLDEEALLPQMLHDGEVELTAFAQADVAELAALAPFGPGNPEPLFRVNGAVFERPRCVGRDHLQFQLRQDDLSLPCIAFGAAARWQGIKGRVDVLCTPQINRWQGRESVQLRVKDLRENG
ncbi:single-stranded-DNA-specific exonuclease RecJ [Geoalkalibacter halelectricus]|uniref:single-stranded-DNA-specific exonuclease RecJ n=1 Tax=Geoalkalibacter halelectricus TaxID=2847045 RepID=UPI003D201BF7